MLGISPKTTTSSSGTATPKITPAGSLQASLASLRTILPNAARGAVFGSSVLERWAVDSWALESSVFEAGHVFESSVFGGGSVFGGNVCVFMPGFLPRAGAVR